MTPDQRAASVLEQHPAARDLSGLGRAISRAIAEAIQAEREACALIAEQLRERDTAGKPDYSAIEQAARLAKDAVASDIARRIRARA